jgi:DNA-binding MarR family transcriptional regulator
MRLARYRNKGRRGNLTNERKEKVKVDLSCPPFSLSPPILQLIEYIAKKEGCSIGEIIEKLIEIIQFLNTKRLFMMK